VNEEEEDVMSTKGTKESWKEVVDAMEGLGLRLKLHIEEAYSDNAPEREALEGAVAGLRHAVGKAFVPVREAVKDPAIRDDLNRIGESLGAAVTDTFQSAKAKFD
jgi:hypothetical protein